MIVSPSPSPALAVTSATGVVGIAVGPIGSQAGAAAAVRLATERRHCEELIPGIQGVLNDADATLDDLDLLVVDVGPGRFTGLRVGVATVRSLAFALQIPVVCLTSLEILAAGAVDHRPDGVELPPDDPAVITAVVDARRGEVFQQSFDVEPGPEVVATGRPVVGRAGDLAVQAVGRVVGDGADQYRAAYHHHGLTVLAGRQPDAEVMLALARSRPARPGVEVEPLYLRDPDINPNVKLRPRVAAS